MHRAFPFRSLNHPLLGCPRPPRDVAGSSRSTTTHIIEKAPPERGSLTSRPEEGPWGDLTPGSTESVTAMRPRKSPAEAPKRGDESSPSGLSLGLDGLG
jgi:hypothetical protein